jgi:hypothetical protein
MAARRILAGLLVAALLPSSLAQGFALCNKDGKPAPPQNVRIARNEMIDDGKYGGECPARPRGRGGRAWAPAAPRRLAVCGALQSPARQVTCRHARAWTRGGAAAAARPARPGGCAAPRARPAPARRARRPIAPPAAPRPRPDPRGPGHPAAHPAPARRAPPPEVTVTFQQATANNNQLGCATMYRVELMENNNAIVKENIKADNPMQDMSFARKLNPGKTYK